MWDVFGKVALELALCAAALTASIVWLTKRHDKQMAPALPEYVDAPEFHREGSFYYFYTLVAKLDAFPEYRMTLYFAHQPSKEDILSAFHLKYGSDFTEKSHIEFRRLLFLVNFPSKPTGEKIMNRKIPTLGNVTLSREIVQEN